MKPKEFAVLMFEGGIAVAILGMLFAAGGKVERAEAVERNVHKMEETYERAYANQLAFQREVLDRLSRIEERQGIPPRR